MTGRLDGRVAVITGGASGIGLETARRFASEGAKVVVADLADGPGQAAADEVGGIYVHADVTDADAVQAMYTAAIEHFGGLDICFNNAGISPPDDDSILETGIEAWRRVQEVNLTSVYLCCKYGIPHLLERGKGSIINTASFVAVMGAADIPDLLHRKQRRRARHDTRARCAVRQAGRAGERAVSRTGRTRRCCRSSSPRTPSAPRVG